MSWTREDTERLEARIAAQSGRPLYAPHLPPCNVCGKKEFGWADERFGCCDRASEKHKAERRKRKVRVSDVTGYQPGLALRPGDPGAMVGSERDFRKRLDDLKRMGFEPTSLSDVWDNATKLNEDPTEEELSVEAAYEEAKANDFRFPEGYEAYEDMDF